LRLSQVHQLHAVRHYAAIIHAWTEGDRAGAVAHVGALRQSGGMLGLTYYASLIAEIDAERGDYEAALAQVERCLALCDSIGERYYEAQLLLKKCEYLRRIEPRGNGAAAMHACRRAFEIATKAGMSRIVKSAEETLNSLP
jgi:ATP/maltotriose-dependent transcriptional regulator MalT